MRRPTPGQVGAIITGLGGLIQSAAAGTQLYDRFGGSGSDKDDNKDDNKDEDKNDNKSKEDSKEESSSKSEEGSNKSGTSSTTNKG